jgi:dihydrofolate reductase
VRLSAQVTLAGIDPSRDQRVQQLLRAGRLDEIELSVVPFLLGGGVRLFEHLDHPIELRQTGVIESSGVTHLRFRVLHA